MNRNESYPFSSMPMLNISRSKINKPHTLKTTFNIGKLVPIYCSQILPGQTVEMKLNSFIRLATPVTPVMDDLICDVYFFFIPNRIIWPNFEKFMGANPEYTNSDWAQSATIIPPKVGATSSTSTKYGPDDLGAYLGLYPANVKIPQLNTPYKDNPVALPIFSYCKVWSDWFRDENFEKEIPLPSNGNGNVGITSSASGNFYTDIVMGYGLAPVAKTSDLFTKCLPAPQKGSSVRIPVNQTLSNPPFAFINASTGAITNLSTVVSSGTSPANIITNTSTGSTSGSVVLSASSLGTINQLREAFAVQRLLEGDARYGTRYIELLRGHFNVSNGDARLQRSEYLGGKRFAINMNQVVQTSGYDSNSSSPTPQGHTAGYSVTGDSSGMFVKSFTEHGWLLGVCCTRIKKHTYSQGIDRQFFFNTRYELYWPELAHIGEQAVYKKELFAGDSSNSYLDDTVFGYQEAWFQYRYKPNRLSGYMATQITGALSVWHYGDLFSGRPTLNSTFIHEDSYQLNRTIAVSSDQAHQFLADFFFNEKDILPMPTYSIPGLVDHV